MSFASLLLRAAARTACSSGGSTLIMRAGGKIAPTMHQAIAQAAKSSPGMTASLATVSQMQRSLHKSATTFASSLLHTNIAMQKCAVPAPETFSQSASVGTVSTTSDSVEGSSHVSGALETSEEDSESNSTEEPHRHDRPKRPPDKEDTALDRIYLLNRAERRQHQPSPGDAAWLTERAELLAARGELMRLRVGRAGLHPRLLAAIGDALEAHELVRVDAGRGVDPSFLGWLLEASQDCVVLGTRGHTLTLFRDASNPRPAASRADGMPAAALAASGVGASHFKQPAGKLDAAALQAALSTAHRAGQQMSSAPPLKEAPIEVSPVTAQPPQVAALEAHTAPLQGRGGVLRHLWLARARSYRTRVRVRR